MPDLFTKMAEALERRHSSPNLGEITPQLLERCIKDANAALESCGQDCVWAYADYCDGKYAIIRNNIIVLERASLETAMGYMAAMHNVASQMAYDAVFGDDPC